MPTTVTVTNTDAGLSGKTLSVCETDQTISGAKTFNRAPNAPFAVQSGSAVVTNLDADKLDGQEGAYYLAFGNLTGAPATNNAVVDGRLSLTSGTAVTTADVTAAGTIYFTPYLGNRLALYDGAAWTIITFSERSLALSITSGKNYDVFVYNNSGTATLELSAAWTNDTTRADALTTQDGVLVKGGATTRRYIGTIRASGANTTEDSQTKRFVFNYYNRVPRFFFKTESTDSWNYTTATIRQANGAAGNQIEVVNGSSTESPMIDLMLQAVQGNPSSGVEVCAGFGEDSTTAFASGQVLGNVTTSTIRLPIVSFLKKPVALGYHYYAWLEFSAATGTTTWYGDNGTPTRMACGITGSILM